MDTRFVKILESVSLQTVKFFNITYSDLCVPFRSQCEDLKFTSRKIKFQSIEKHYTKGIIIIIVQFSWVLNY